MKSGQLEEKGKDANRQRRQTVLAPLVRDARDRRHLQRRTGCRDGHAGQDGPARVRDHPSDAGGISASLAGRRGRRQQNEADNQKTDHQRDGRCLASMTKNHVPSWCNFFQARALGQCGATLNLRAVDVNGFLTYRLSIALVPGRASTSCSSPGQAVGLTSAVIETIWKNRDASHKDGRHPITLSRAKR